MRIRELDFLRGVAIILVLFNHLQLFEFTQRMGWIGVDLFFVLSGYLVSGLLFKEYMKFGDIQPFYFLIRRGFKIYPLYYLIYPLYLLVKSTRHQLKFNGIFSDLVFIQNYKYHWSYAFTASWSLAVEEHFYVIFSIVLFIGIKLNHLVSIKSFLKRQVYLVELLFVLCFVVILFLRIMFFVNGSMDFVKSNSLTHFRIDSLLAGVLVSYWRHFKHDAISSFVLRFKGKLWFCAILLLLFTPFIDHLNSIFAQTIGFTMIYIAFSFILMIFIFDMTLPQKLNLVFTKYVVDFVSLVGVSSYAIYLIHGIVIYIVSRYLDGLNVFIAFCINTGVSISVGYLITIYLEKSFLNLRNRLFPNRII